MKKLLLLVALFYAPMFIVAQDCAGKIAAARASKKAGNYRLALAQYAAAADCGVDKSADIQKEILEVYDKIEKLKEDAFEAKKRAEKAEAEAKAEDEKNRKIISAFYFFKDSFAVAVNDEGLSYKNPGSVS